MENLVNFPIKVNLGTTTFNYASTVSNGVDLRFVDSDTRLF